MRAESGTVLPKGRPPGSEAAVAASLRAAGAVVLGKTVTTECAYFAPGKTRNPHNPEHTPGGSSSGSAAAGLAPRGPLVLGKQAHRPLHHPPPLLGRVVVLHPPAPASLPGG